MTVVYLSVLLICLRSTAQKSFRDQEEPPTSSDHPPTYNSNPLTSTVSPVLNAFLTPHQPTKLAPAATQTAPHPPPPPSSAAAPPSSSSPRSSHHTTKPSYPARPTSPGDPESDRNSRPVLGIAAFSPVPASEFHGAGRVVRNDEGADDGRREAESERGGEKGFARSACTRAMGEVGGESGAVGSWVDGRNEGSFRGLSRRRRRDGGAMRPPPMTAMFYLGGT